MFNWGFPSRPFHCFYTQNSNNCFWLEFSNFHKLTWCEHKSAGAQFQHVRKSDMSQKFCWALWLHSRQIGCSAKSRQGACLINKTGSNVWRWVVQLAALRWVSDHRDTWLADTAWCSTWETKVAWLVCGNYRRRLWQRPLQEDHKGSHWKWMGNVVFLPFGLSSYSFFSSAQFRFGATLWHPTCTYTVQPEWPPAWPPEGTYPNWCSWRRRTPCRQEEEVFSMTQTHDCLPPAQSPVET